MRPLYFNDIVVTADGSHVTLEDYAASNATSTFSLLAADILNTAGYEVADDETL